MTMLKIHVSAEIVQDVYVTWSPEYGAQLLGDREHVTIEEIPTREIVNVPVRKIPPMPDRFHDDTIIDLESRLRPCLMCNCPGPHEPQDCPHECLRYVEG